MIDKNLKLTALIYGIVFAVYNLLVFTIFKSKTDVFWLSYAFGVLAFILQALGMFFAFKKTNFEAIFFGIPLASFSFFYFFSAIFASTSFMIFQKSGMTIALTIQLILVAIYAVISILSIMARDTVQELGNHYQKKVSTGKLTVVDVEMVLSQCSDFDLKNSLKKLIETIKYSDPISNEFVEDLEGAIKQKISEMRTYNSQGMIVEAQKSCSEIELLYIERNHKLKATK
jgi:hypothetical protein